MRTKLSTRSTSAHISLFVQFSLVVSFTVLPVSRATIVRGQDRVLPSSGPSTLKREAPEGDGPTTTANEQRSSSHTNDYGHIVQDQRHLQHPWDRQVELTRVPSLAESVMGFGYREIETEVRKKSPAEGASRQQESGRPMPTPPPGIGSGGSGPDGSFNIEPPIRLQGPPPGVRSTSEVLNETRPRPRIPDPIPSTQSYCWPGDPACRKPAVTAPKPPAPKPTPPPRPQSSSLLLARSSLLVANNDWYIEKLMKSAAPYLSHLWNVGDLLRSSSPSSADSLSSARLSPFMSPKRVESSLSYVWADCTNVQGYADNAQSTVYIYVDGAQVGTTQVDWNNYFIFDISLYVNDGGYHNISAWYYTWDWIWMEAGSTSVTGCFPDYDFDTPRLDPPNDTGDPGVNPGSQNINWSVPLVGLPGRELDLNLLLTYNSLVWTRSADGAAIMFDADHGFPSPGFRLRFPIIQPLFFNPQAGVNSYMLITSTGARIELRQVSPSTYESADSSYMKMVDHGGGSATVWLKDGTQMSFSPSVNDEMRCTQVKDRNGNFISVTYTAQGNIDKVTDTLGRQVVFNYDVNQRLLKISQARTGLVNDLVTFGYENVSFGPSFPGLTVFAPTTSTIPVLTQVGFADGTRYNFEYTTFGQVNKIRRHEADGRLLSYVRYNLGTGSQSDCPRFSEERVWAENWNDGLEALTSYSGNVTSGQSQVTTPDGVIHKAFYHTSGWREGLVERTETWWDGVRRKWTEMYWTQDNEALSYQVNPRPNDVRVIDEAGNQRRVTIEYTSFGLPANVREYSGASVIRRRETQYQFDAAFVSRHILGVVSVESIYENESTLVSKLSYQHDASDANSFNGQTPLTGHDSTNYGSTFIWGRANVTGIRRYNLAAPNDDTQAVWITRMGYNAAGSPFLVRDAADHNVAISYTDSFSDGLNRGTLAHPTTVTDGENFSSTFKYHYDLGAITRAQDPKGAVETTEYDTVGRLQRVTNQFTSGYTRWEYTTLGELVTIAKVDANQLETVSVHYVDGAGRARGTISHLPNSTGGWRAQMWSYDIMGRLKEQTNPTEVTQAWQPAGDDAAGWVVSRQTYDWQGRPRLTTNQDGSTRELSYTGCGCAGGDVVTARDERGRRRRLTSDVLGRLVKVEELNWDTSVYATTTYTYNARDQLTQSSQAGQLRANTYDNHGRLLTRTTPEQGTTTYGYNADDTVQTITDARNAVMSFSYNPRKLVTGITFSVPSGVAATPNVTFAYDAAGNRTTMASSESTVTYGYDTASRLTAETRTFNGLSGSFTLNYAYNQFDQLTEITRPGNVKVGYAYNQAGEITGVTGQGYAGVTSYANGMVYRAFGGLKQMSYANERNLSLSYNNRMFLTQWSIPNVLRWNYAYHYFNENTGRVVYAQNVDDPTLDRSYDYDHLGRPTHFTSGSNARNHTGQGGTVLNDGPYSQGYSFDVWGNRTYFEGWGGIGGAGRTDTASYTNNRRNGFTYDGAGNLTNDGGQTFTYDATGQQATASYSGYLLQQSYDGERLRVKKVENGAPTYYLRSTVLGGQIVAEINNSGSITRGFVYLGGQLLAVQQSNQVSWVHQDPVAKSKRVTDAAGAVISTIELDPWGGDTNRSSNEAFQPRRFTTYDRDGNASDEAMHRRYNRWHTRFDQPDPYGGSYNITDPQSFNRYSYVQNDPVNFVDPSGLCPEGTTPVTDPATGEIECVQGPSASVDVMPGRDDPFWDSFRASAGRPLIIELTPMPAPLRPLLPLPQNPDTQQPLTKPTAEGIRLGRLLDCLEDAKKWYLDEEKKASQATQDLFLSPAALGATAVSTILGGLNGLLGTLAARGLGGGAYGIGRSVGNARGYKRLVNNCHLMYGSKK